MGAEYQVKFPWYSYVILRSLIPKAMFGKHQVYHHCINHLYPSGCHLPIILQYMYWGNNFFLIQAVNCYYNLHIPVPKTKDAGTNKSWNLVACFSHKNTSVFYYQNIHPNDFVWYIFLKTLNFLHCSVRLYSTDRQLQLYFNIITWLVRLISIFDNTQAWLQTLSTTFWVATVKVRGHVQCKCSH